MIAKIGLMSHLILCDIRIIRTGKIVIMPDRCIFFYMTADTGDVLQQISEFDEMIEIINQRISIITEKVKDQYLLTSSTMSSSQNYLLSGIQKSPSPKNYIITNRGIEVVGEQELPCFCILRYSHRVCKRTKQKNHDS